MRDHATRRFPQFCTNFGTTLLSLVLTEFMQFGVARAHKSAVSLNSSIIDREIWTLKKVLAHKYHVYVTLLGPHYGDPKPCYVIPAMPLFLRTFPGRVMWWTIRAVLFQNDVGKSSFQRRIRLFTLQWELGLLRGQKVTFWLRSIMVDGSVCCIIDISLGTYTEMARHNFPLWYISYWIMGIFYLYCLRIILWLSC